MKNKILIYTTLVFIMMACAPSQGLKETRLDTGRSSSTVLLQGPILNIDTFDLKIIPPSNGVRFYRDGIIFLASSKNDETMLRDHLSFGIIKTYYAGIYEGTLFKYTDFSPSQTFDIPSDATTFSKDFRTMYFTQTDRSDSKEKIYCARRTAEDYQTGWSADIKPLGFCIENSVYTHPALSADGTFIIFSSDRGASAGSLDLFISHKKETGWSEPDNMGPAINSAGNDLFAFLDSDNNLYFSSDRAGGAGGFDIYMSRYDGTRWNKPVAINPRINTPDDEVAFTIDNRDGRSAFFTRRAGEGRKSSMLLYVTINSNILSNRDKSITALLSEITPPQVTPLTAEAKDGKPDTGATALKPAEEKGAEATLQAKEITQESAKIPVKEAATSAAGDVKPKGTESTDQATAKNEAATADTTRTITRQTNAAQTSAVTEKNKVTAVYRVQIITTATSKGSYNISIGGKSYKTWEYLYKGAYRTTVGDFGTLAEASRLQSECRKAGYKEAFVVVFVNGVRSTDPALFK